MQFIPKLCYICLSSLTLFDILHPSSAEVAITQEKGVTTFWFNFSNIRDAAFIFSGCDILDCPERSSRWNWYATSYGEAYICITNSPWNPDCSSWGAAAWNTGSPWGYKPQGSDASFRSRMTIIKTGQGQKPHI